MKPDFSQASGPAAIHAVNAGQSLEVGGASLDVSDETFAESLQDQELDRQQDGPGKAARKSGASGLTGKAQSVALISAAVVLVAIAAFLINRYILAHSTAMTARTASPVVTVTALRPQIQTVTDSVAVTGSISAWDPLSVGAEVSGLRIVSVEAEEGQLVKSGQPLCLLNSALLRARLAEAKARLGSAEVSLKKTIRPNRIEEVNALRAALKEAEANAAQEEAHVRQARVNLENADINADRFQYLNRMGAASKWDAETHQVTADNDRQEVMSAEAKLLAAKSVAAQAGQKYLQAVRGGRSEDVDMSKATIAETKAQIAQLNEQIAETVIRAPDSGLVAQRNAHIGDITSAGSTLFSIIRLNRLELRAQVPDLDLSKFKVGQTVSISSTEDAPAAARGKVILVSPQVDPQSRLGIVRIQIPADAGLKPGMFVRGEVKLGERKTLTVPQEAVVTRNGESFVFTLDDNHAVAHPIKTGVQAEKYTEIISGLSADTLVVGKGARFLNDHDLVRVSQ